MGSGTDGRMKGRREERSCKTWAGPGLLNPSWDQIRAGPGAGAGVGRPGQSWAGPAAPSLRSAEPTSEWRDLEGPGGRGGGSGQANGTWSARPEPPGLEAWAGAGLCGATKLSPRQLQERGREQHPKTETQTDSGEREGDTIGEG